jgi:hypothetical protein
LALGKGGLLFRGVVGLCKTEAPGKVYIHHIKYAQMSLRTLLYGSPVLCGAIAWLVLVTVAILVRREVK